MYSILSTTIRCLAWVIVALMVSCVQQNTEDVKSPSMLLNGDTSNHNTADCFLYPNDAELITQHATYPGGTAQFSQWLMKTINWNKAVFKETLPVRLWISFTVEKDGQLSNITVEKNEFQQLEMEIVNVLKLCKPWNPAISFDKPVAQKYKIPIKFELQ